MGTLPRPTRAGLIEQVLPLLVDEPPVPDDAEQHLTQIRWFLAQCDGTGAQLTVNHTLSRALLTEACHRFNWLILGQTCINSLRSCAESGGRPSRVDFCR